MLARYSSISGGPEDLFNLWLEMFNGSKLAGTAIMNVFESEKYYTVEKCFSPVKKALAFPASTPGQ